MATKPITTTTKSTDPAKIQAQKVAENASKKNIFIPEAQKQNIAAGLSSTGQKQTQPATYDQYSKNWTANQAAATAFNPSQPEGKMLTESQYKERLAGKPVTPTPATTEKKDMTPISGSGKPIWEIQGMTRDEYIAKNQAQSAKDAGVTVGEGQVYDRYAALRDRRTQIEMGQEPTNVQALMNEGRAKALRTGFEKEAGAQPVFVVPKEGFSSPEEEQRARLAYQTELTNWYKKVGEIGQKEIGAVSSQVADFGNQMAQYQGAIDTLVANLNTAGKGDFGSAITKALEGLKQTGGGSITPDALAQITQAAEKATDPTQFQAQVTEILKGTPNKNLEAAGVTKGPNGFTTKEGLEFSMSGIGVPDISLTGAPKEASGGDLAAMELAVGVRQANVGLEQELAILKDYSKSVARSAATSLQEIQALKTDAQGRVDESQKAALDELKYQERKLSIEKDKSLRNLVEEDAKMEGYMKAQLEAWGANESTAGLAVMGAIKTKFLTAFADTEAAYDTELARVSDLEVQARMAYTNRVVEISNQALIATQKVQDTLFDAMDKVETGTSTAYQNKDLKVMDAYRKYFGDLAAMKAAEDKAKADAAKDTRDFNLKLMKEYADQSGYAYEISPDGQSIAPMRDKNGNKIPTLERQKMNKSGAGGEGNATISKADEDWLDRLIAANPQKPTTWISQQIIARDSENSLGKNWVAGMEDKYNSKYYGKEYTFDQPLFSWKPEEGQGFTREWMTPPTKPEKEKDSETITPRKKKQESNT